MPNRLSQDQIVEQSTKHDAFHLILSMPARTDPLAVQRAARALAAREFSSYQYAMVLHTFETDPDPNPSRHPQVHLTVKTVGLDGIRLNPRKAEIQHWREGFAEALRDQGIDAMTTSILHRTTHERWTIRRGVDPIIKAKQIDRRLRVTPVQRAVVQNYERVMKASSTASKTTRRRLPAGVIVIALFLPFRRC